MYINNLVKKTGIYLIGNLASKAIMTIIVPIYAFFVTQEALGEFDYVQSVVFTIAPIVFVALWEAVLRFIMRDDGSESREVMISNVVFMSCMSTAIVGCICLVCALLLPKMANIVITTAIMTFAYGFAQVWQYLARASKESRLYAGSGVCATCVNFACVISLVCIIKLQFIGLCLSYTLGQLSVIVFIERKMHYLRKVSLRDLDLRVIFMFLRFSAPLAMNLVFLSLVTSFGRMLITNVLGASENGLYTFAMKFGSMVSAVGSIFAMAVIEEAILRIDRPGSEQFFTTVVNRCLHLLLLISIIALPAIGIFYQLLGGTGYEPSFELVPCFLLWAAVTVTSTVAQSVFQATRTTHLVAVTSGIGAAVTVASSLVLIDVAGTFGVACALVLGSLAVFVARVALGRKRVEYRFSVLPTGVLVCVFVLIAALERVPEIGSSLVLQLLGFVLVGALCAKPLIQCLRDLKNLPNCE